MYQLCAFPCSQKGVESDINYLIISSSSEGEKGNHMSSRLSDRLNAALHEYFVGREIEKNLFHSAITATRLPFSIIYIYGPGGVGKTSLLKEFMEISVGNSIPCIYLDTRNIDPSPIAFLATLQRKLALPSAESPIEFLYKQNSPFVLLVDTYESLAPLDEWMVSEFLPQLPENTLVVFAGRLLPGLHWKVNPGWQSLMQVIQLRNLDPGQSRNYLFCRGVPEGQHQAVLHFTHGHPLALSLVADYFAQREGVVFVPEETPDVVKTILELFVQKVPGPAHRTALEACALVRVMTEALLSAMLDIPDVHDLFDWLRGLSFVEYRRSGLFPHDLARDALVADLHWRNPDWYIELKRRARKYYSTHLDNTSSPLFQQRILIDYVYLHRDNPFVRPFFEWQLSGNTIADSMRPGDIPLLVDMVNTHEGKISSEIARYWFEKLPEEVTVVRGAKSQPAGFLMMLPLHFLNDNDSLDDPGLLAVQKFLSEHAPLRPGERATFFRFWMGRDDYQSVSPIQSLIFIHVVRHYLSTPGLAFTFIPCAEPEFWAPVLSYADMSRISAADFSIEGRTYGIYGHDWRLLPPTEWLELMGDREDAFAPEMIKPPHSTEQLVVLSREAFSDAVKDALRNYVYPNKLISNPLLRSRLVLEEQGVTLGESERVQLLARSILQAVQGLSGSQRSKKFFQALDVTYLHPRSTQEDAAEALDLPFSTYRRHLKSGIQIVTEILWQRELGNLETE